jgi:hypothetical protein
MTLDDARKAIIKYVREERAPRKKLNFKDKLDRHRGFFAWRRATTIGSLPSNAPLLADPDLKFFKGRIELEYAQLDTFLETKVITLDPFGPDKTPNHLDLHDLAKPKLTTASAVVKKNEATYRVLRRYRIRAIGWRAAAIHDEVWQASSDGRSAILRTDALDMLIDRRLHMVERMNFQISRADALGGEWSFKAPFEDDFRIRMFEYPRIPKKQVRKALTFIDPAQIEPPGTKPFQPGGKVWRWESTNGRLIFNVPPFPGLNLPPEWVMDTARIQSSTTPADKLFWAYFRLIDQGSKATDVLATLFKPDTVWTGRKWLFCDHVISALHLEALLFASRRRDPAGADQKFNALMGTPTGPISIGGFLDRVGASNAYGRLLSMANDPHFENIAINEGDLQVGDHVVVYNSKVFGALSPSEWILENSVVIDVDSDHSTGGIVESALALQGHGTEERKYATYLERNIAGPFNEFLNEIRRSIARTLAADAAATTADWNGEKGVFVKWDPYGAFSKPGPWWIKFELRDPTKNTPIPPAEGKLAILGSVIHDTAGGTGYNAPPSTTAVYFPLYRPAFGKGWDDYLNARRTKPTLKVAKNLKEFVATGDIMPGLFFKKKGMPIPVLRPKVQP